MVRYRVKAGRSAVNEQYLAALFAELEAASPAGLRYASFRLDDGLTYVHLALIDTASGENPLDHSLAFKAFSDGVAERCAQPPVVTELSVVGAFGFLGPEQ